MSLCELKGFFSYDNANVYAYTHPPKNRCDENFKASAFMHETLTDSRTASSGDVDRCAFSWAVAAGAWKDVEVPDLTDSASATSESESEGSKIKRSCSVGCGANPSK